MSEIIERLRRSLAAYQPRRLEGEAEVAPAAVLILVYGRDGEPHVLLTERTHEVEHHKGQISFPGGAFDDGDGDLLSTALRETYEEIGVRPEHVEVLGQLDDIITVSNFRVTPYVGLLRPGGRPSGRTQSSYPFALHPREVAALIQVPLRHLLSDGSLELELRQWRGEEVLVPAYLYNGHRIWGATARMLQQFLGLVTS